MSWELACVDCGCRLIALSPQAKRCDDCRRRYHSARARQRLARIREATPRVMREPTYKTERNAAVYEARAKAGQTLAAIAERYGVTKERVRQIVNTETARRADGERR